MPEYNDLANLGDTDSIDSETYDPDYVPSSEHSSDTSDSESLSDMCFYCGCDLDYTDNEFYIEKLDRFCCKVCWEEIDEH